MGKGGGGKSTGKALFSLAGFAFGFMNPVFFLGEGATAVWTAGIMGASLAGTIWSATHKLHEPGYNNNVDFDVLQNTISDEAMIPIIYGTRKWGGYETWHDAPKNSHKMTKDIIFCEGEIDSINDIKANDLWLEKETRTVTTVKDKVYIKNTSSSIMRITFSNTRHSDPDMAGRDLRYHVYQDGQEIRSFYVDSNVRISKVLSRLNDTGLFSCHTTDDQHAIEYVKAPSTPGLPLPPGTVATVSQIPNITLQPGQEYLSQTTTTTTETVHDGLKDCYVERHLGAVNQEPPSNYSTVGSYKNCAWMRVYLSQSDQLAGGNPTILAIIKGLKIVDTRTGVKAYSNNPAMCVRDYLLAKRYGAGRWITQGLLDEDSFKECANYCDEMVSYYVPSTLSTYDAVQNKIDELTRQLAENPNYSESVRDDINDSINSLKKSLLTIQTQPVSQVLEIAPRYTTNIILAKENCIDNLQDLLATFGGFLVYSGNKISLRMEKSESLSYSFDDSTICSNSDRPDIQWTTSSLADTPNRYEVKLYDPQNNYVGVIIQVNDDADQKERHKIISKSVDLVGVTDQSQALRLARIFMAKNRLCPLSTTFKTATMAMHLQPGDIVELNHGNIKGLQSRITQLSEDQGKFTLKVNQYNASIYDDRLGAQITYQNYSTIPNALSDTIPELTNVSDTQDFYILPNGESISTITLTWDELKYTFYRQVNIEYSIDEKQTWYPAGTSKENYFVYNAAVVGKSYYFRLKVENQAGRMSNGVIYGAVVATGKSNPPNDLSNFVAVQIPNYFRFTFDTPTDLDYNHTEIRFGGTTWGTAMKLGDAIHAPAELSNSGVSDGTVIFRAKAVDNSGIYSQHDATCIIDVTGINKYKNVVLTRDDVLLNDGELTGLVPVNGQLVSSGGLELRDFDTFADLPKTPTPLDNKHFEYLSPVIDLGKVGSINVNFLFDYSFHNEDATFADFPDRTFADFPNDTFANITVESETRVLVRFSKDNIIWSDWQSYVGGSYEFRYIQYSLSADYGSPSVRATINSLAQTYDVPDITFKKRIEVPSEGVDIHFADYDVDFWEKPTEVIPTVLSGFGDVYSDVTNLSKTGLTLKCYDRAGTQCNGTVLLVCRGY